MSDTICQKSLSGGCFSDVPAISSGGPLWRTSLANQIEKINYVERFTRDSKAVNLDLQMQAKKTVVKYPHKWRKLNVGTLYGNKFTSIQALLVIENINRR